MGKRSLLLLLFEIYFLSGCAFQHGIRPSRANFAVPPEETPCTTSSDDVRKMPGRLFIQHLPGSKTAPLYELRCRDGTTRWFSTFVQTDVCTDGVCKPIQAWLFWDGVGNYMALRTLCKEPLTKSDHTEFSQQDYQQLDRLLADSSSVLKEMTYEDLILEEKPHGDVDAVTSATTPALTDVVVKDAVYSCFTLWHTVYGEYHREIQKLLAERSDTKRLRAYLRHGNAAEQVWAVRFISRAPEEYAALTPYLYPLIEQHPGTIRNEAFAFFQPNVLTGNTPARLIALLPKLDADGQSALLYKLRQAPDMSPADMAAVLILYEKKAIDVTLLYDVFQLATATHLLHPRIKDILSRLSSNENPYIRNMTRQLLDK